MKTFSHLWQYIFEFFLESEVFQIKVVGKIETHILRPVTFFRKSCRLWVNVEEFILARDDTDEYTAHALWMSEN